MNNPEDVLATEPERFFVSPPSLKTIASQKMALVLYQHLIRRHKGTEVVDCSWLCKSVFKAKDLIETMPVLEQMIDHCMWDPVGSSLAKWYRYHEENVFFDGGLPEAFSNCIDCFVLTSCGEIDYSDTARNILDNDKLNAVEKFRLACINCFGEDVRSIWPLVCDNPRVTTYSSDEVLIHYWIRVMNGESPRLLGADPDSYEDHMCTLQHLDYEAWTPIGYFWNVLSENEQIKAAKMVLEGLEIDVSFFLERVLLRLNNKQLRKVLEETDFGAVIYQSVLNRSARIFEHVYEIWSNVKYFISPHKFFQIMVILVLEGSSSGEKHVSSLLLRMWTSAPDQWRCEFLNDSLEVESLFRSLHRINYIVNRLESCDFSIGFLIPILTEMSFQSRNAVWCEFWPNLIVSANFELLDHAMKLCFNNEDEITNFKEHHMMDFSKIQDFCFLLISNGYLSRINDYLNFCSSHVHLVASAKQKILASSRIRSIFPSIYNTSARFVVIDKFIDGAFLDEDGVKNYKRQLMSTSKRIRKAYRKADKNQLGISWV